MSGESLKEQLEMIRGGNVCIRKDEGFSSDGVVPTYYIVEFVITNCDLFYKYIPPFAEHIFCIQCVKDMIMRFSQKGMPYTISFPVEID